MYGSIEEMDYNNNNNDLVQILPALITWLFLEMHQFFSSGIAAVSNSVYMVIRMFSIALTVVENCKNICRN
jgi:hypothetical protein